MHRRSSQLVLLDFIAAIALYAAPAQAVTFVPLGDLPGGAFSSTAYGISGDGRVVVGQSRSANGREAFRWTAEEGMVGLGDLPGGEFESFARAASFDGSVVVGGGRTSSGGRPFRWTEATGLTEIGIRSAIDVSADGNIVVGHDNWPVLWTAESGAVPIELPLYEGEFIWDSVNVAAVSADGRVVVGNAIVIPNGSPYRWTQDKGSELLFTSNILNILVEDVSADGSVVVGWLSSLFDIGTAFRWTEAHGISELPFRAGRSASAAFAVSADGSIIVGAVAEIDEPSSELLEAAIWDEVQGWTRLEQILIDSGWNVSGWSLRSAGGISADGTIVVGNGINPDGNPEAWLADLSNPTLLPGDYDGKLVDTFFVVDQPDLDLVLLNWGADATTPPDGWIRNLPRGLVDQNELDDVLLHWGARQSPRAPAAFAAPVPEPPAGWLLLALLLSGSLSRSPSQPAIRTRPTLNG